MSKHLTAVPLQGIRPDSLGNYFIGLGLVSVLAQKSSDVRASWRDGSFVILGPGMSRESIEEYVLTKWKPTPYERWWADKQKADTKAGTDQNIWKARSKESTSRVRVLDAHLVGVGRRNQFNSVMQMGGKIGQRDLARVSENVHKLLRESEEEAKAGWLEATLFGESQTPLPRLTSVGTWFVFANKSFNSGQSWSREGQLSPWSFLLALEGALILVGGASRRLGANARAYAVFPFISDVPSPVSEGEVGAAKAEFWAPLWKHPATVSEVRALFERGLARIGQRAAKAPHEFAVAARAAGVDAGVTEFVRFTLRQTTSSQVYEAVPSGRVEVASADRSDSELIQPLIPWLDRLPYEPRDSKQSGKFKGLRGPIEQGIIRLAERPDGPERWQQLLLTLADTQSRIDRNRNLREPRRALPWLVPEWFQRGWPTPTPEIRVARAIASTGAGTEMPILANVFGVEFDKQKRPILPKDHRPQRAIWHRGDVVRLFADVLERRLIDTDAESGVPLTARCSCSPDTVISFLSGALDFNEIGIWIRPLSLIDWSRWILPKVPEDASPHFARDGTYLLQALFRPLFSPYRLEIDGDELFPEHLRPRSTTARRLLNLIRQGEWTEAIQLARNHYLAAGRSIVLPSGHIDADGNRLAASLLIPVRRFDVVAGLTRWLQPSKTLSRGERL